VFVVSLSDKKKEAIQQWTFSEVGGLLPSLFSTPTLFKYVVNAVRAVRAVRGLVRFVRFVVAVCTVHTVRVLSHCADIPLLMVVLFLPFIIFPNQRTQNNKSLH
jgi:hypothetical protein